MWRNVMFVLAPAASPAASKRTGPSINPLLRSLYLARPGWKHCRFCSVRWFKAGAELSSHILVISCYTVSYIYMYRLVCSKLFKSLGSFHLNFHWRRGHKVILVMPWLASEHQAVLVPRAFSAPVWIRHFERRGWQWWWKKSCTSW